MTRNLSLKATQLWRILRQRAEVFLFAPASPAPLAVLRIGTALTLLIQAWYLAPYLFDLYGEGGILQLGLGESAAAPFLGLESWLRMASAMGIPNSVSLTGLGWVYVLALIALLVGAKTKIATVVVWFLHVCFIHGQTTSYGVDAFSHVALFLLIWTPSEAALSIDRLGGPIWGEPSSQARLSIRVFQIYLSIAYFASGLEKWMGPQWWNGEAVWRSVTLPSLAQYDMGWLASYPWIARFAGWGTLLVEAGYAIFIWPRQTRRLWMWLAISMHVGIAVFLGLWLFSLMMIFLNLAAFGRGPWETTSIRASVPRPGKVTESQEGVALG